MTSVADKRWAAFLQESHVGVSVICMPMLVGVMYERERKRRGEGRSERGREISVSKGDRERKNANPDRSRAFPLRARTIQDL